MMSIWEITTDLDKKLRFYERKLKLVNEEIERLEGFAWEVLPSVVWLDKNHRPGPHMMLRFPKKNGQQLMPRRTVHVRREEQLQQLKKVEATERYIQLLHKRDEIITWITVTMCSINELERRIQHIPDLSALRLGEWLR